MKLLAHNQRIYFNQNHTKQVEFRIQQLKTLRGLLKSQEQGLYNAIYADFKKSDFDTYLTEFAVLNNELDIAISHLRRWTKTKRVSTNVVNFPGHSYIIPE